MKTEENEERKRKRTRTRKTWKTSSRIQRASHSHPRFAHHMRVDLGRGHVGVAEEILHGAYIGAALQQVRGKTVPQRVRGHALVQTSGAAGFADRKLECGVEDMVPPLQARMRVAHDLA